MRLIDADKLLRVIDEEIEYGAEYAATNYQLINKGLKIARRDINCAPTIEAQPVMHGEWIPSEMNAENKENAEMLGIDIEAFLLKAAYCSFCGVQQITNGRDRTRKALIHKAVYRYCPNCGAKMGGGNKDG